MKPVTQHRVGEGLTHSSTGHLQWHRVVLLIVIGYETMGCLLGGILLVAKPDGRLMNMPVNIMHGVFPDFFIPGLILFGLGILGLVAFNSVFRRTSADWFMAGLTIGALYFWFIVEIIILQELHWLHLMWGLPVMLGAVEMMPLIYSRHHTAGFQNLLLTCGILSSLWYVAINMVVPMHYADYSFITHTVSELSAINAPTRISWVLLVTWYPLLYAAFGWGVMATAENNRALYATGSLMILYAVLNLYWPPMHLREVIADGRGTLTDTLHILWAMLTLLFMMLTMGFGAASLDRTFRYFTAAAFLVFVVFGFMIGTEAPNIRSNLPTPYIGLWERINIATFMLWVAVFSTVLLRRKSRSPKK